MILDVLCLKTSWKLFHEYLNIQKFPKLSKLHNELLRFLSLFSDIDLSSLRDDEVLSYDAKMKLYGYIGSILFHNNMYIEVQKKYFNTIIEKYKYQKKVICLFCLMIIFYSNTDLKEKTACLNEKIILFYETEDNNIKEFTKDIMELNTEVCKLALASYYDHNELKKIDYLFDNYRIERVYNKIIANHYNTISSRDREKRTTGQK